SDPTEVVFDRPGGLIGESRMPEIERLVVCGSGTWIVAEAMCEISMETRIVTIERLLRDRERFLELPLEKSFQRKYTKPYQAWPGLELGFGERGKALGKFTRARGCDAVAGPLPE